MLQLTLAVPGLFGALDGVAPDSVPPTPALDLLLARAARRRRAGAAPHRLLCRAFGLTAAPDQDLPVAAITRLIDGVERPEGIWMRADPVHVSVSMTGMTLMDPARLVLTQREAIVLGAPLKQLFAEHGWGFEIPTPQRWYLQLDAPPGVRTWALDEAVGREVRRFTPDSEAGRDWDRVLTEAQMLLHQSEVNQEREQAGRPPANSLWLWGAGALPEIQPRRWSYVAGGDPLIQGLAMLSATPHRALPDGAQELLALEPREGAVLAVLDPLAGYIMSGDFHAWRDRIERLERCWVAPLMTALQDGRIDRLQLLTDAGDALLGRRGPGRFWRRVRPLPEFRW